MGIKLRTSVPQTDKVLVPRWLYLENFREMDKRYKEKQKENFDARHRVEDLPPIPDETEVWVATDNKPVRGAVNSLADRPRSYVVYTPTGQVERNRSHFTIVPGTDNEADQQSPVEIATPHGIMTRSRTGTAVNPPDRL